MLDKVAGMVDGPLVAAYRDAAIGRESGDIKLMPAGAARWRKQGLRARAGRGRFRSRRREKSELSVPLPSEQCARLCVNPL